MVIRNKEYYTQFNEEMKRDHRVLDYHIRQAENYKRIYQLTRGRSGVYVLLNKWAKKMNQIHCDKGFKNCKVEHGMVSLRNDVPTELHSERRGALTGALPFCADLTEYLMKRDESRGEPRSLGLTGHTSIGD